MRRTYTLLRPIFGFREEIGQVVQIPAGAVIVLAGTGGEYGITLAFLETEPILVFQEDLVNNGILAENDEAMK